MSRLYWIQSSRRKDREDGRGKTLNLSFVGEGVDSIQFSKELFSQPKRDIFRGV